MTDYPPLVSPEEVRIRMQRPAPFAGVELTRVQAVCVDASALVRAASGSTWLDPDDETRVKAPEMVSLIARRCAERAVRNPEGFSTETVTDYSFQRPKDGSVGEGGLFLTPQEVKSLQQVGGLRGGLWGRRTYRGDIYECERLTS